MPRKHQQRTFREFMSQVEELVNGTAAQKGYSPNGPDGPNLLFEFVEHVTGGPHHAIGEGIYKLVRYEAKHNPEDLLKAAAWCFLAWRHHR